MWERDIGFPINIESPPSSQRGRGASQSAVNTHWLSPFENSHRLLLSPEADKARSAVATKSTRPVCTIPATAEQIPALNGKHIDPLIVMSLFYFSFGLKGQLLSGTGVENTD